MKGETVAFWRDEICEVRGLRRRGRNGEMLNVSIVHSEDRQRPVVVNEDVESVYRRLGWDKIK